MEKVTLASAGRRYWKSFLPIWLFPWAFLGSLALPGFKNHGMAYFVFFDMPLMALCSWPALKRWREGGLTFAQMFFWFAIVPFVIWTATIMSIFLGASLADRASGQ